MYFQINRYSVPEWVNDEQVGAITNEKRARPRLDYMYESNLTNRICTSRDNITPAQRCLSLQRGGPSTRPPWVSVEWSPILIPTTCYPLYKLFRPIHMAHLKSGCQARPRDLPAVHTARLSPQSYRSSPGN